jgi:hypothetical protein
MDAFDMLTRPCAQLVIELAGGLKLRGRDPPVLRERLGHDDLTSFRGTSIVLLQGAALIGRALNRPTDNYRS